MELPDELFVPAPVLPELAELPAPIEPELPVPIEPELVLPAEPVLP